jgi:hypothetical protein
MTYKKSTAPHILLEKNNLITHLYSLTTVSSFQLLPGSEKTQVRAPLLEL